MANENFPAGVAFVTGGSGGIGGAIVEAFARAGSDVVFTYRNGLERAEKVRARAVEHGVNVEMRQVKLEEPESLDAALAGIEKIHSFVYASGPTVNVGYVGDLTVENWRNIFEHDTIACFSLVKAALAFLKKHPVSEASAGSITTITSSQKFRPESKGVLSASPKAAVEALMFATAKEYARFKIRANVVQSGWVMAGQVDGGIDGQMNADALKSIVAQIPLRRMGSAAEVAEGVVFLSSAKASFITGATLVIDGGMHL